MQEKKIEQEEKDYTEQYNGIIMLRKDKLGEEEVWFATIGTMLISDGALGTKEELIDNIEHLTLNRVCRMMTGVADRIIRLNKEK